MNDLSWLIYLAGVTGNIQSVFIIGGIIALIIMVSYFFGLSVIISDLASYEDERKVTLNKQRSRLLRWLAAPIATIFVACLLPSSGTVYAIAASEMGEEVLNSETGGKAVAALNAWLDRQLAPPAAAD